MPSLGLTRLLRIFSGRNSVPENGEQFQTITILGEDCNVTAHQTGMATWKAYGYVKGIPIQATGDNPPAAFSGWRKLARTNVGRLGPVSST